MTVSIYEALNWASSFLRSNNLEEPSGEWLLRYHTKQTRASLLAHFHDDLDQTTWEAFQKDVKTLTTGVPVQHLIGYEEFYGRRFFVSKDVLIPRPETEELIELILKRMASAPLAVLDIGTGSGAIAVTLKKERPDCTVSAIDLSTAALQVAERNAQALAAPVELIQGDLLDPVKNRTFDVIVSNPPYIPEKDKAHLSLQVREFEPSLALFAGKDGLEVYRRLASQLPNYVHDHTIIALEVGFGQSKAVKAIFQKVFPLAEIEIHYDINKKDRMIFLTV